MRSHELAITALVPTSLGGEGVAMLWWWLAMIGVALAIVVLGAIVGSSDARFVGGHSRADVPRRL